MAHTRLSPGRLLLEFTSHALEPKHVTAHCPVFRLQSVAHQVWWGPVLSISGIEQGREGGMRVRERVATLLGEPRRPMQCGSQAKKGDRHDVWRRGLRQQEQGGSQGCAREVAVWGWPPQLNDEDADG